VRISVVDSRSLSFFLSKGVFSSANLYSFINRNDFRGLFPILPHCFVFGVRGRRSNFESWPIGVYAMFTTSINLSSFMAQDDPRILFPRLQYAFEFDIRTGRPHFDSWQVGISALFGAPIDFHSFIN
jgi:hypothetical protein